MKSILPMKTLGLLIVLALIGSAGAGGAGGPQPGMPSPEVAPPPDWIDPTTTPPAGAQYVLYDTPARGAGMKGSYLIYLPDGYATSGKRYPVIYWLHMGFRAVVIKVAWDGRV